MRPRGSEHVRERYRLPPRYVFYPANTWHHKNHARLIDALARYRAATGETLPLVLTGIGREGERALAAELDRTALGDSVRVLGFVPSADLPALYAGAACLVFPSLFEGFGMPLVEAMLVGCPIAASRTTSIPEVVADAAVLFDPQDAADIARAIAAIVRHPAVAAELVRRGRARRRTLLAVDDGRSDARRLRSRAPGARAGCGCRASGHVIVCVSSSGSRRRWGTSGHAS